MKQDLLDKINKFARGRSGLFLNAFEIQVLNTLLVEPAATAEASAEPLITASVPATDKTRPYEESTCRHCKKAIWRITDGHGQGWMHRDQFPNWECLHPQTHAEPITMPASAEPHDATFEQDGLVRRMLQKVWPGLSEYTQQEINCMTAALREAEKNLLRDAEPEETWAVFQKMQMIDKTIEEWKLVRAIAYFLASRRQERTQGKAQK